MDALVAFSVLILAQFLAAILLISRRTELYATPNKPVTQQHSSNPNPDPWRNQGIAGTALSTLPAV